MLTAKQERSLNEFLGAIGEDVRSLYRALADCLAGLGYRPNKTGTRLHFVHTKHSKQIAKFGVRNDLMVTPFFALRFSACQGYSKRFGDVVAEHVDKYPKKAARCPEGLCSFCNGAPDTHVYTHILPDGTAAAMCGAYTLEIQNLCEEDLDEIKRLLAEEHAYLMEHETAQA